MKSVQSAGASVTARPSTTVLLIRHGETDAMATRLTGRLPNVHLNDAGVRQARALGERLARIGPAALYSSPLLRARSTADALAAELNVAVEIDNDLSEVDFGEWTGLTFEALAARDDWRAYNATRGGAVVPGGESPGASAARVTRTLHKFHGRHPGAAVVAVTHAELIRYALLHARNLALDRWADLEIPPASVTILRCCRGGIREDRWPSALVNALQ